MNVQQLFEAFGNIDDQYIEEAASDAVPHLKWKIAGVAAAAAAVIAGTILFSSAMLNRPTPTEPELAAPIVTAAPVETAQPASEPSGSVPVAPEGEGSVTTPAQPTPAPYQPTPVQPTPPPAQPTPTPVEPTPPPEAPTPEVPDEPEVPSEGGE